MGPIARMVAVVSVAATAVVGGASVAQAAPLQSSPAATTPASVQTVHEFFCGQNYDYCVKQHNEFRHYGLVVSDVWYRQGQTCGGGGGCGDGWLFNWEE
jgi:hypothetical protein